MVKEERGGQPWRRKQAEQRKWHGRAKSQDLSSWLPASGSTLQGRPVGVVGLLRCDAPAWSLEGGWVGERPRGREVLASCVFHIRAPSTQEPLATLRWTSSSACRQLWLLIKGDSSMRM